MKIDTRLINYYGIDSIKIIDDILIIEFIDEEAAEMYNEDNYTLLSDFNYKWPESDKIEIKI